MIIHEKLLSQAESYLETYRSMYEAARRAQRLLSSVGLDSLLDSASDVWSWEDVFWVPSYHPNAAALPDSGKVRVTIALDGSLKELVWPLLREAVKLGLFDEWQQDTARVDGDKLVTRWVAAFEEAACPLNPHSHAGDQIVIEFSEPATAGQRVSDTCSVQNVEDVREYSRHVSHKLSLVCTKEVE